MVVEEEELFESVRCAEWFDGEGKDVYCVSWWCVLGWSAAGLEMEEAESWRDEGLSSRAWTSDLG